MRTKLLSSMATTNLSVVDSTPTPEITSSERITWVLIYHLGILPALWLSPHVLSWLRRANTGAAAPSSGAVSSGERLDGQHK